MRLLKIYKVCMPLYIRNIKKETLQSDSLALSGLITRSHMPRCSKYTKSKYEYLATSMSTPDKSRTVLQYNCEYEISAKALKDCI